jgi:hypothetical protein
MYLLTIANSSDDGAYALKDKYGEKVLLMFQEEDDATRYALMLGDSEEYSKEMSVVEVEDDLAIKTCKMHNYKYTVVTPNDIVVPPLSS